MGTTTMPKHRQVSLDEAKTEPASNRYGYSYKAFEAILAAHNAGNGLEIEFPSITSSNKMVGQVAFHAGEAGFDLFTRRAQKSPVRYFWLEPKKAEDQ